jgi:hypothetical protein
MTGEVIMSIAYGFDVPDDNDPYITLAQKASKSFSDATLGQFLVVGSSCLLRIERRTELRQDFIPMLKYVPEWVPGTYFKRIAREGKVLSQAVLEVPFAELKRQIVGPSQFKSKCHLWWSTRRRAAPNLLSLPIHSVH